MVRLSPPSASSRGLINRRNIRLDARGLLTTYPKNTTGRGYDVAIMRANSLLCNSLSKGSSSGHTQRVSLSTKRGFYVAQTYPDHCVTQRP